MDVKIQDEQTCDVGVIHTVIEDAFRGQEHTCGREAGIVEQLREAGALSISLVARCAGQVVGHIALSPVETSSREEGWYGLGPVSVLPGFQRQGIGALLVNTALERLREIGAAGCVLVGHPEYYGRFGFHADGSAKVEGMPAEATFCMKLRRCADPGAVEFHPAFGSH